MARRGCVSTAGDYALYELAALVRRYPPVGATLVTTSRPRCKTGNGPVDIRDVGLGPGTASTDV